MKIPTLSYLLAGMLSCVIVSVTVKYQSDIAWQQRLLKAGFAEYDRYSGKWMLSTPDSVLFRINNLDGKHQELSVRVLDYVKTLEKEVLDYKTKCDETLADLRTYAGKKSTAKN